MTSKSSGETDLRRALASLKPRALDDDYVFCSVPDAEYGDHAGLSPIASFTEDEGLTLVVPKAQAEAAGLDRGSAVFRCITLSLHTSLEAVGVTASVSAKLAARGISANMIAARYHDHVFVPADRADEALSALDELRDQQLDAGRSDAD